MAFIEITDQLERSARNGTRAHLPAELVRAIIEHPCYESFFLTERKKELVAQWDGPGPIIPTESASGPIGSNTGPSAGNGASAGTIPPLVHAAAERRAYEAVDTMHRLTRRARR
jgi:hypothetical protein